MKVHLVIDFDPNTKRWSAHFPELPGCSSAGDTKYETVCNAKEALHLWLEKKSSSRPLETSETLDMVIESMDDSTYLISTAANRTALAQSLREAHEGNFVDIDL